MKPFLNLNIINKTPQIVDILKKGPYHKETSALLTLTFCMVIRNITDFIKILSYKEKKTYYMFHWMVR